MTSTERTAELIAAAKRTPHGRLHITRRKLGRVIPAVETSGDPVEQFVGTDWVTDLYDLVAGGVFYEESADVFRLSSMRTQEGEVIRGEP